MSITALGSQALPVGQRIDWEFFHLVTSDKTISLGLHPSESVSSPIVTFQQKWHAALQFFRHALALTPAAFSGKQPANRIFRPWVCSC